MALVTIVHLVDDDPFFREAITLQLQACDYRVVNHVSGIAFLADLAQAEPGCILLDLNMPGMSGLEVQSGMKEQRIEWPVVVLTAYGDMPKAIQAMKNGAIDFLEKPCQSATLIAAVTEAFDRLDLATRQRTHTSEARQMVEQLTPREFEVLRALLSGMTTKTTAHYLGLSSRTVDIYRGHLMSKLRVRNVSLAVQVALAAGVTPLVAR